MIIRGTTIGDDVLNQAFADIKRTYLIRFNSFHTELILIKLGVDKKISDVAADRFLQQLKSEGKIEFKDKFWHYID